MPESTQVSTTPEFSHVQQLHAQAVSPDLGNNMWAGVGQGVDNFMNGLVERAGEMFGAGVAATLSVGAKVVSNMTNVVAHAGTAPFKDGFIPSMSPRGQDIESPNVPARSQEIAVDASREQLGVMSPPSTPSVGVSVGQSVTR